jgi:hypothetical protein
VVATVAPVEYYVVRVWLPDRPGALGHVASRIGAVRGDVIGIDILERGGGLAVDELVVSLPDGTSVGLLVNEVTQVDGVAIEDIRRVDPDRPDAGIVALDLAAQLVETEPDKRLSMLCRELNQLVDGDWAIALGDDGVCVTTVGDAPDAQWLLAFFAGSSHLTLDDQHAGAPGDLAWARLDRRNLTIGVGRRGRPFHTRERRQMHLLGRIADALIA